MSRMIKFFAIAVGLFSLAAGVSWYLQGQGQAPAKDNEWSTYVIRVEGKHIVLIVNGKTTIDYTEPTPPNRKKGREGRVLSSGTFALQAHDPGSTVYYKNIRIKALN